MSTKQFLLGLLGLLCIGAAAFGVGRYRTQQLILRDLEQIPPEYTGTHAPADLVPTSGTLLAYQNNTITIQQQTVATSNGEQFANMTQRTMLLSAATEITRLSTSSGTITATPADRTTLVVGATASVYISAAEQSAESPTAWRIEIIN